MSQISPISPRAHGLPGTFAAFQERSYRRLWSSNLLSYIARWMQVFVISLFILDRTNSPFLVALVGFFSMAPVLFLGMVGGVFADRVNQKRLLVFTTSANLIAAAVFAATLGMEFALDREIITYWHGYMLLLVTGTAWALDMPTKRSVVLEILGRSRVTNGIALDSVAIQSSQLTGPVIAGLMISFVSFFGGYVLITAFYVGSVLLMLLVKVPERKHSTATGSTKVLRNLMDGFKYVRGHNTIMAVVMITIFMNLLLFPYQQMVPVIGKNLLALAPWQIGVLQGATGMGALIGGIAIASSNSLTHHGKVYLYGSLLALTVVLLFSFSKWFVVSLPLLVILGAGAAGFGTMQSAIVVLSAREEMRGRALGVITVAIGANPLGALLIGVTATMTSPSTAITINAVLGLLIVGAIGFAMPSLRQPITADESAPQSETALASTKSVT